MNNFFELIFSSVNLPLTILLIILVIYWLLTMISGIDFDLDFDVEVDVDADFDIDTDSGLEGGNLTLDEASNAEITKEDVVGRRQKPLKWWQVFLIYFNFVGLPFMFTFTAFVFAWWTLTMLGTAITYSSNNILGAIIFFVAIIPSLFLTKIFTTPFKSFFKRLNKDGDEAVDFLGRKGVSLSTVSGDKMGRAEVFANENPMNIYIKSLNGEEIKYQENILIIKESADKTFFYVKSYNQ